MFLLDDSKYILFSKRGGFVDMFWDVLIMKVGMDIVGDCRPQFHPIDKCKYLDMTKGDQL